MSNGRFDVAVLGAFIGIFLFLFLFACSGSKTFTGPTYECCKHNHGKCMGERFPPVCGAYIPNAYCDK